MPQVLRDRPMKRKEAADSSADIRQQMAAMVADTRHLLRRLEDFANAVDSSPFSQPLRGHIPERGRVGIVGSVDDAPEVTGRQGVALAGGPDASGEWTYSVLVDTLNETYILPESSLQFLGWTVPENVMYRGTPHRVRVDADGTGTVIRKKAKQGK